MNTLYIEEDAATSIVRTEETVLFKDTSLLMFYVNICVEFVCKEHYLHKTYVVSLPITNGITLFNYGQGVHIMRVQHHNIRGCFIYLSIVACSDFGIVS